MWFFAIELAAVAGTVVQIAFLPRLFFPFSDLFLPGIAVTFAVLRDRPLTAALWALTAGFLLDLYGLFGFGVETAALFAAFLVQRHVFTRFLTNASAAAVFLLAAIGVAARFGFRMAIDGLGVLLGGVPILLGPDLAAWSHLFAAVLVNGAAVLAARAVGLGAIRRFRKAFLPHAETRV